MWKITIFEFKKENKILFKDSFHKRSKPNYHYTKRRIIQKIKSQKQYHRSN